MIRRIDHIGIAVRDLKSSVKFYSEVLGLEFEDIQEVKEQKVRVAMFPIGDTRLELLESTSPDGPIARFIDKRGEGMHHIAYRVENLEGMLLRLDEVELIDEQPSKGADDQRVAFIHPKSTFGVLIELCE